MQGPLVLEPAVLGLAFERGIMAMAFGDELTNMLQPFWALPCWASQGCPRVTFYRSLCSSCWWLGW